LRPWPKAPLRPFSAKGYLVVRLAVENAPAEAAELGIAHAQVTAELHRAVAALVQHYEHIAFAAHVEEPGLAGTVRGKLATSRKAER
jgi:hypothetical protein